MWNCYSIWSKILGLKTEKISVNCIYIIFEFFYKIYVSHSVRNVFGSSHFIRRKISCVYSLLNQPPSITISMKKYYFRVNCENNRIWVLYDKRFKCNKKKSQWSIFLVDWSRKMCKTRLWNLATQYFRTNLSLSF